MRAPCTEVTTFDGLRDHRRAGRVEDHTAGPHQVEGRADQLALQHHQREQVVGLAPPPRLGAAAQRAQPGAGRVDQHPVEDAGAVRRQRPVGRDHADHARDEAAVGGERPAYQPGAHAAAARWRPASRRARRPAPRAARPCRPGPAHRSSQSSSRPSSGASAIATGDQLRSLVLDAGAPLGDRRHRPGSPPSDHHAVRRVGGRLPRQLVTGGAAGPRDQGDPGILVVGGEQLVQLALADGLAQLVDHPLRVAEGEGGVPGRRRAHVGGDLLDPLVEVALAHRAEHRVGEVAGAGVHPGPDQVDGGADRGVVRHPHRHQLVGAEPQRVEHLRLDLRQRPVDAGRQDRVVGAASPDRPRRQLGGERRVAPLELVVPDHGREDQVGVGVVDPDRLEHVECGGARRIEHDLAGAGRVSRWRAPLLTPRAGLSHRRTPGTPWPGTWAPWSATRP